MWLREVERMARFLQMFYERWCDDVEGDMSLKFRQVDRSIPGDCWLTGEWDWVMSSRSEEVTTLCFLYLFIYLFWSSEGETRRESKQKKKCFNFMQSVRRVDRVELGDEDCSWSIKMMMGGWCMGTLSDADCVLLWRCKCFVDGIGDILYHSDSQTARFFIDEIWRSAIKIYELKKTLMMLHRLVFLRILVCLLFFFTPLS